jgi:hypothetical protein
MISHFNKLSILEHYDLIGITDCRKSMGDHDGRDVTGGPLVIINGFLDGQFI